MRELALSDLAELTACYSNTAPARITEPGIDPAQGFAEQLRLFATGARSGINRPDVAAFLLARSADAPASLSESRDLVEYFWFLFSQKAWLKLLQTARAIVGLGELPLHVADLVWLSFYRGQTERLLSGADREMFEREAESLLGFVKQTWPTASDRHALYAAMVAHVTGNAAEARKVFLGREPSEPLIEPLGAVRTVLPVNLLPRRSPDRSQLKIFRAAAEHVTLISLDRTYFDKYAHQVARKFFQSNPGNGLHLHCVGFDPTTDIGDWKLVGAIGWTADHADLEALTVRDKRGYYAAARYIFLPDYLTLYQSVFVADVDGLMIRNVADIDAEHADQDIILSTLVLDTGRQLNRLPWEAITACAFMARATAGGRSFATAISGYLLEVMRRTEAEGRPFWYADQTALYYSWFNLQTQVRFGRFHSPPFKQVGSWKLFQGDAERLQFLGA